MANKLLAIWKWEISKVFLVEKEVKVAGAAKDLKTNRGSGNDRSQERDGSEGSSGGLIHGQQRRTLHLRNSSK